MGTAMTSQSMIRSLVRHIAGVPGVVDGYVQLCDLFGRPPLYDSGWRRLHSWLEELERSAPLANELEGQRVFFFSDLPFWVDYSLAVAVLLLARGASIDFAWLPHATFDSEVPPTIGYPFWFRSAARMHGRNLHPRLSLIDLEKMPTAQETPEMREIASQQAYMDVSYLVLRERIDLERKPRDRVAFEFRRQRNLDALLRVAPLLKKNRYDRVLLGNGLVLEYGAIYSYVKELGLPISTYEVPGNGTLVASKGQVLMMDLTEEWKLDEPHIVSPERHARIQSLIEKRQLPNPEEVGLGFVQLVPKSPPDEIRARLRLVPDKPLVLICPNCPFDAAYNIEGKRHFKAMWEWLEKTVRFFLNRTDCQVVVRSHPGELYYNAPETTASLMREYFPDLPAHIHLVLADDPISTYSLMDMADFGVVYWSTTGLEMAMRGIPVICGVPAAHYNGKGFTIDSENVEDYYSTIERILRNPAAFRLNARQVELAWCYADIYFNEWPQPFPWAAGRRFWKNLNEWPIRRMLTAEGNAAFGNALMKLF